jgi:hypothetical protein
MNFSPQPRPRPLRVMEKKKGQKLVLKPRARAQPPRQGMREGVEEAHNLL